MSRGWGARTMHMPSMYGDQRTGLYISQLAHVFRVVSTRLGIKREQWRAGGQGSRNHHQETYNPFNQQVFDSFRSLYFISFFLFSRGLPNRDASYDMSDRASGIRVAFFPPRRNTLTLHNPGTTTTALHSTLQIRTTLWDD